MATPTDPTFGSDFDAAVFRAAITSTMEMGMATGDYEAIFFWEEEATYTDGNTVPYDLTATPDSVTQVAKTLSVPVAVESNSGFGFTRNTGFGQVDSNQVRLTLLDEHWDQVSSADGVTFDDVDYTFDFSSPVVGLFSVNVHTIVCSAMDEAV